MTTSSIAGVKDQICQFFGGPYNATTRDYRTPTVSGLSVVCRGWAKRTDFADFTVGRPTGTLSGCILVVQIPDTRDRRIALPALDGRRKVHYDVQLHGFLWSKELYAQDAQDYADALRDALVAKIRTDPGLGSGGIENPAGAGFQVGEGSEDGGAEIVTHLEQQVTEMDGTKGYLLVSFEAHAYDIA